MFLTFYIQQYRMEYLQSHRIVIPKLNYRAIIPVDIIKLIATFCNYEIFYILSEYFDLTSQEIDLLEYNLFREVYKENINEESVKILRVLILPPYYRNIRVQKQNVIRNLCSVLEYRLQKTIENKTRYGSVNISLLLFLLSIASNKSDKFTIFLTVLLYTSDIKFPYNHILSQIRKDLPDKIEINSILFQEITDNLRKLSQDFTLLIK